MTQSQLRPHSPLWLVADLARALRAELIELTFRGASGGRLDYKIKKPVRRVVDYGTLDFAGARRGGCADRRLAPSLYLGVTRITGTCGTPALEGPGPVLEYAVRMRRFARGALFGEQLQAGTLASGDVDKLATLLADFHSESATAAGEGFASTERRAAALWSAEGAGLIGIAARTGALRTGRSAVRRAGAAWTARRDSAMCGSAMATCTWTTGTLNGEVAAFDCIEFDPALRGIDVLDDVASPSGFQRKRPGPISHSSSYGWLDRTGDHAALPREIAVVYRAWCAPRWNCCAGRA